MYFYSGTFILLYLDKFTKYFKILFPIAIVIYYYQDSNFCFQHLNL